VDGSLLPISLPVTDLFDLSAVLAYQEAPPLGGEVPAGGTVQPGATGSPGTSTPPAGQQGFNPMFILLLGMGVFMVMMLFTSGRRQKKEQRERQAMLDALKRNDKVQTIGGIIGTVAEVRTDEVVLKVDDAGQNRVRFARSAIQQVLSSRGGPAEAAADDDAEPLKN
jgi:preprotein translocase subunit YajC